MPQRGQDRILVFEDTNGDGKFDKRTVFMEGLNLVSGLEVGFGAMDGAAACQQALGIRANVIVTTRACNEVPQSPGFDEVHETWPTNPEWANNDAARLADAMLAKIKV